MEEEWVFDLEVFHLKQAMPSSIPNLYALLSDNAWTKHLQLISKHSLNILIPFKFHSNYKFLKF